MITLTFMFKVYHVGMSMYDLAYTQTCIRNAYQFYGFLVFVAHVLVF